MVPLIVLLTIAVFILVDVGTRLILERRRRQKILRERQEALDIGLRLEFTEEAPSLKRVEVDSARARILAVDDEPVVLDSFRKILVLAGFSVDTVETGREAVGLVRKHDYDFVFTDLKMPEFDGLEVTKAVKHLRPDIDVIMITGYGTIESAVAAMQYGAMDYVEKPFTEDELVAFSQRSLIRRQARLEREVPSKFHLVAAGARTSADKHVVSVAGGRFVTPEHTWLGLELTGELRVGLDDFATKMLREIDGIRLPLPEAQVARGDRLFSLHAGDTSLVFTSPVSGRVTRVNADLDSHLELLLRRPYDTGWICVLEAGEVQGTLTKLKLGAESLDWYRSEVESFLTRLGEVAAEHEAEPEDDRLLSWRTFASCFLDRQAVAG